MTEERRLGNDFPYPGWGIVTASREQSPPRKDSPSGSLSPRAEESRKVSLETQASRGEFWFWLKIVKSKLLKLIYVNNFSLLIRGFFVFFMI